MYNRIRIVPMVDLTVEFWLLFPIAQIEGLTDPGQAAHGRKNPLFDLTRRPASTFIGTTRCYP